MNNKLSIIIPFYNVKKEYLERCIKNIIKENIKKHEIILVNDGSTINYDLKKIKDIKYIKIKHQGVSVARNTGIDMSTNNNLIFIDADDYLENNALIKIEEYLNQIKKYDIIIFDSIVKYKNKIINNVFLNYEGKITKNQKEELELQIIYKNYNKYKPKIISAGVVWAKVYNKQFLINNNIYFEKDLIRCQDSIFNLNAIETSNNIYYRHEKVYVYNRNIYSTSYSEIKNKDIKKFDFINNFICKNNKSNKFKECLNLSILETFYIIILRHIINNKTLSKEEKIKKINDLLNEQIFYNILNIKMNKKRIKEKIFIDLIKNKKFNILFNILKMKETTKHCDLEK